MGRIKDLTGQRYGRLIVLNLSRLRKNRNVLFLCRCDCGKEKNVKGASLVTGNTKSCGCLQKEVASEQNLKDITGIKFSRLTVLKLSYRNKRGVVHYSCQCECGEKTNVRRWSLVSGKTKSCGCLKREQVGLKSRRDLIGKKFGRLIVLKSRPDLPRLRKHLLWECQCECGKIYICASINLIQGFTKSCGCYSKDVHRLIMQMNTQSSDFNMNRLMKRQQQAMGL